MTLPPLIDPLGRHITYLRVSVTDRCDLRCVYCMSEHMRFLPKLDLLTFEELDRLCTSFIRRGVRKLRLTGGEPLMRRGFMDFVAMVSRHLGSGALDELALTTNATRLAEHAGALADAGVKRINVSLDTLSRANFARIARKDRLDSALEGIAAAQAAGIKIKINTVVLKRDNSHEIPQLINWAHEQGFDISLIETMPLGEIDEDRTDQYVSLAALRRELESYWTLTDLPDSTGGPSRYVRIHETGGRLGFITPLSHNFCAACNRVRLTCTGRLYMCLGQNEHLDFRSALREGASDDTIGAMIENAIASKPEAHEFKISAREAAPALARHMSVTGG